jgi:hypothetical protein
VHCRPPEPRAIYIHATFMPLQHLFLAACVRWKGIEEGQQPMAEKEFLGDRRRSQEEEYIHRQEQQLIAKLRQRRQAEATRRRMAEC